jgi:hypothetical protein
MRRRQAIRCAPGHRAERKRGSSIRSLLPPKGALMIFRIRYRLRGEWTCVDVSRLDGESPDRASGHALFRTAEWLLLYIRLGQRGPMGFGGAFEVNTRQRDQ